MGSELPKAVMKHRTYLRIEYGPGWRIYIHQSDDKYYVLFRHRSWAKQEYRQLVSGYSEERVLFNSVIGAMHEAMRLINERVAEYGELFDE